MKLTEREKIVLTYAISRYGFRLLNKKHTAEILGISVSTLDLYISRGFGPKFIKMGVAKNATIRFELTEIARYMCQGE